ncbi:TIGR00730 family Rossman fold protein [Weissella viridescens]|uniref:LOG family protein n=1 Tax=Weissella viridescens TaxID=1629 RepID=UPI001C7DD6DB|nr:TIGR00730 family Rossman fold protein [Weissella viridescens]MBX4172356.1 TIGR00730 family Rossman fold protein [Weissella viridescens]
MQKIAVYCGASTGNEPAYADATVALGTWLAEHQLELVYGGGGVGLMGLLAQTVLDHGGVVHGIMPQNLYDRGAAHPGLTDLEIVPNMSVRKQKMLAYADGCIALPGGPGTLEEIVEAFSWARIGDNDNPCVFYDVNHYYRPIQDMFQAMVNTEFLTQADFDKLGFFDSLPKMLQFMENYEPPLIRQYTK